MDWWLQTCNYLRYHQLADPKTVSGIVSTARKERQNAWLRHFLVPVWVHLSITITKHLLMVIKSVKSKTGYHAFHHGTLHRIWTISTNKISWHMRENRKHHTYLSESKTKRWFAGSWSAAANNILSASIMVASPHTTCGTQPHKSKS